MPESLKTERIDLSEMEDVIREVLESGGEFRMFPRGTSMLPLLREGRDSVILEKASERLKKYDIPFYKRRNGKYVLHRIIKVSDKGYVLRGDNQYEKESGITDGDIIGVVTAVYRGDKRIECSSVLIRIYGFLWCTLVPLRRIRGVLASVVRKLKGFFVKE